MVIQLGTGWSSWMLIRTILTHYPAPCTLEEPMLSPYVSTVVYGRGRWNRGPHFPTYFLWGPTALQKKFQLIWKNHADMGYRFFHSRKGSSAPPGHLPVMCLPQPYCGFLQQQVGKPSLEGKGTTPLSPSLHKSQRANCLLLLLFLFRLPSIICLLFWTPVQLVTLWTLLLRSQYSFFRYPLKQLFSLVAIDNSP